MTPSPVRSARRALHRWVVMLSAVVVALLGVTAPATAAATTGSFAGRVTDVEGAGVAGVLVTVYAQDGSPVGLGAYTDAEGDYQVDGLPEGDFIVQFWGWDGGYVDQYYPQVYAWEDAMGVPVTAGQTTQGVHAVLELGGTLSGVVTDGNAEPVAGASVWLYGADTVRTVDTDEFGYYEFPRILPRDYTVWFDGSAVGLASEYYDNTYDEASAVPVAVPAGGTTPSIDATLGGPGSISGRVTGPSGVGVAGVTVSAIGFDGQSGAEVSTAADGTYTIEGLMPGDYTVAFDGRTLGLVSEYFNDVRDWSAATPVGVFEDTETVGIDAALVAGGSITGTVTRPGGLPAENVTVWAYPSDQEGGEVAYTDAAGRYRMDGVKPGEYLVQFSGTEVGLATEYYNDAATYLDADAVLVTAGVVTPNINAALDAAGSISGTVTGPGGLPVAGVYVSVTDAMGIGVGAYTGEDGTYLVEGLRAGSYTVRFEGSEVELVDEYYDDALLRPDADLVTVVAAQTTSHIDAALAAGGSISGTVTGPGGPVVGVWVNISGPTGWWTAMTDAAGSYTVSGLATGAYRVRFDADELGLVSEYYDDSLTVDAATDVVVTAPEPVTGIDAVLVQGATISGTVTGPEGPVQGVWVAAVDPVDGVQAGNSVTDVNGDYTIEALPAGTYAVSFQAASIGLVSEYYDDSLTLAAAETVTVTTGQDVWDIDAVLEVGGSISGTVTGPAGPVDGVYVSAWGTDGIGHGSGYTDTDGTYVITGLAPDQYEVCFTPPDESLRQEYYDDQVSWRNADLVPVAEDQAVTGIDAVLTSSSIPLFTDVPVGHPFDDEIEWLAESGVTTGYPDGTFHPSASVERQAMAAFLYRFAGEPAFTPPATPSFTDVPRSHPFFKEIEWLADTGITTGWPDRTFRPMASVERQAMAAFLYRYAEEPAFADPATASFTDVPRSSQFFTEVEWLADTGISTGWADHTFRPGNQVERQAMAAFLMRFDQWLWA